MPKFSAYMKGSDGSQGPAGASIIDGILVNEDSLPQQAGHGKHAYLVGTTDPKNLWVWDEENSEWKDQGPIANRIGEVTATMNAIPWTTTAIPSVQTQFSTSNQIDSLNFDFTIPFLDNAYDVINNKVNRDGDTITGDLIIGQTGSLHIQQSSNAYTDSNFSVGRAAKTYIGNAYNSGGYTRTGITQENANGNKEYFRLPISYSTENDNTYDILTSKTLVTVGQGGTGVSTATANYVFAAPAANNGSPSFRQLVANDIPDLNASKITDGILPITRGGTGAIEASAALSNLGAVSKSGDIISGTVTFFQPGNSYTNSILCVGRAAKTYIGNAYNSGGYTRTGITQENANGNKEYFRLPISYSTENDNTYDILTSKTPITIEQGGTATTSLSGIRKELFSSNLDTTAQYLTGVQQDYAEGGYIKLPLPIVLGGTNATTAANAIANLGAVSKSGDKVTGQLFIQQPANNTSVTTQMNFVIGRTGKTYIAGNGYSSGTAWTSIIQQDATGAYEEFKLPSTKSTDSGTHYILTSKTPVTLEQGGTGTSTSPLFLRPGDSFTITQGHTGFPGIASNATACYFTVFTTYPIRSDVSSAKLTGNLTFRLAGKSRVNVNNVSLVSSAINQCGIVFEYTATTSTFDIADVINVSFRVNAATITLS